MVAERRPPRSSRPFRSRSRPTTVKRPRGRPPQRPTTQAFDSTAYLPIAVMLAKRHITKVKDSASRPGYVWADLLEDLSFIAWEQMRPLARRYNGAGTPEGYLWKFLPRRCDQPFHDATGRALNESAHM